MGHTIIKIITLLIASCNLHPACPAPRHALCIDTSHSSPKSDHSTPPTTPHSIKSSHTSPFATDPDLEVPAINYIPTSPGNSPRRPITAPPAIQHMNNEPINDPTAPRRTPPSPVDNCCIQCIAREIKDGPLLCLGLSGLGGFFVCYFAIF